MTGRQSRGLEPCRSCMFWYLKGSDFPCRKCITSRGRGSEYVSDGLLFLDGEEVECRAPGKE